MDRGAEVQLRRDKRVREWGAMEGRPGSAGLNRREAAGRRWNSQARTPTLRANADWCNFPGKCLIIKGAQKQAQKWCSFGSRFSDSKGHSPGDEAKFNHTERKEPREDDGFRLD